MQRSLWICKTVWGIHMHGFDSLESNSIKEADYSIEPMSEVCGRLSHPREVVSFAGSRRFMTYGWVGLSKSASEPNGQNPKLTASC